MHPNKQTKRNTLLHQRWRDLLFLHWRASADTIQAKLPPGLQVDLYKGQAYLGVVPFYMQGLRPPYCPPVPGISTFPELNLRTYVRDTKGRPGVWFFSLDAQSRLSVAIARNCFNLPYQYARMQYHAAQDGTIRLESKRRNCHRQCFEYRPSNQLGIAAAGSLDAFLVERYRLFANSSRGQLYIGELSHTPYALHQVELTEYSTKLFALNGFEEPDQAPCHIVYSPGVQVRVFAMQRASANG